MPTATFRPLLALPLLAALAAPAVSAAPPAPPVWGRLPSVSPDGKRLAFVAVRAGKAELLVINADGSGEQRVGVLPGTRATWSADGKRLWVGGEGDDSGTLFEVPLEGGQRKRLATFPGRSPVPSPDGSQVAFLAGPWTASVLMVARADGSGARAVAGGNGVTAWNPAWSPDGQRLAYTFGDASRVLQVHVVELSSGADRAVTHLSAVEGSAQLPAWSADGGRLAFQGSNSLHAHVWVADLKELSEVKLAPHPEAWHDEAPAWFPDGKRLAFQSDRSGRTEVWVMNADGSGLRQVTGR